MLNKMYVFNAELNVEPSSIFKMYVFECRAECRTHSSIFKVCFILNAELNVDLTARYSYIPGIRCS